MHDSQFAAFCIFSLFQEAAGVFCSSQSRVEADVALVSPDLTGVLLLFDKKCLLEQAHQDIQKVESPYRDSWRTQACIITSVFARLGKFCKHPAAEKQATKVYQGNKTSELDFKYLKFGLTDLKCENVAFVFHDCSCCITYFRKYYPEPVTRASRHYCNINKNQLFWHIVILKEGSQNAVICISILPLLCSFRGLGFFLSLLWLTSFIKAANRNVM